MVFLEKNQRKSLGNLFSYTQETIVLSCIQGHHGGAWADNALRPSCAKILAGGYCILAGNPSSPEAPRLAAHLPEGYPLPYLLIQPQNEAWAKLVEEAWAGRFQRTERYAIKKEPGVFEPGRLRGFIEALPPGYLLRQIDGELYRRALEQPRFEDFCSNFDSEQDYLRRGLGFCATLDGQLVGGASSFTMYDGGIEIEIATDPGHRRKGVALACAAKLILTCLERGLYPSWDAANMASVRLSEKLGYHFDHAYPAYAVTVQNTGG